ncbi:MAG: PAS domain S-box protein [Candidatus Cloacimonetes bacterium]|nr:PAS domain S-box protein [Candidatus Cloacimonadota bacterium]
MDKTQFSVLITNASLLLITGLLYDIIVAESDFKNNAKRVFYGIIIGVITLGVMTTPWIYSSGIIFDTRSIILSISGLYFGFIPTLIAAIMAIIYRMYQGGAGVPTGVSVIITASAIGYIYGILLRRNQNKFITIRHIVVMSYITHITMLLLMLLMPAKERWIIIKTIAFSVFTIYPAVTVLLGNLLNNQKKRNIKDALIAEKEEQFRSLYEQAPIPYQSLTPDLKFINVNHTWLHYMGYKREEIINKSLIDFIHPEDKSLQNACFESFKEKGFADNTELRLRKSDGSYCTVSFVCRKVHDSNGNFIRTHGIFRDITNEREAISAMKESQQSLYNLFTNAPIGIFKTTSKGKVLSVNPELARMLGFNTPQDALNYYVDLGKDMYVKPERRKEFLELLRKEGKVEHFEYEARTKNGNTIWISMNAKVSGSKDDEELIIEGFALDITSRKSAEKELKSIEWMLTKRDISTTSSYNNVDMSVYNKDGLILKSIGKDVLSKIIGDYLSLLDSSSAVYEKNGDYAFGTFASPWCGLLDSASRALCPTDDIEALNSGLWLCHESCWKGVSQKCIETGKPVDILCTGGIHLYGEPIFAGDEIIGSLNIGYGSPPQDLKTLSRISELYHVDIETLQETALKYETRPVFIIEQAKRQLHTAAQIIGEIVGRKIAQDKLIVSEAVMRGLFENMTSGVAIYKVLNDGSKGSDYIVDYFNNTSLKIEDKTLDEVIGKSLWELRPNIDDFGLIPIFQKTFLTGNPEFYPAKIYVDEKYSNWYENRVFKLPTGHIVALYDDVTERVQAMLDLKENEAYLRSILSAAPVGIGVLKNRVIQSTNSALSKILGYSKEELLGQDSRILYPNDEEYEIVGREKYDLIDKNGTGSVETKMQHKDGHIVNVILSSTPFNQNDISEGLTFTVMDISSRKQIEDKIRNLNQELESKVQMRTAELLQANKELQAFAYSVAHDLRTPLRAINGFTQFLIEAYYDKFDEEGKRLLGVIMGNTKHMDKLITDLLSLTKIAREPLAKSMVNHEKIISAVISNNFEKKLLEQYKLVINPLPVVCCDGDLMKQVWTNLISNAIKYTAPKDDKYIEIGCKKESQRYVFFIKDNGVGFDSQYIDKLFGVFQRLHKSTDFEGTGVGLAIVQSIINKHNGEVWANGVVDQGAEFYFTLPILEE